MSSGQSKVLRLYREIDKSLPDKRPYDTTYFRERKEVFDLLQPKDYNTHLKSLKTYVAPVKHHGKLARLKAENRQSVSSIIARERELEHRLKENRMRAYIQEYRDNDKVLHEMQSCMAEQRPIPAKTVQKLFAKDSDTYQIKNLILTGDLATMKEVVTANATTGAVSTTSSPGRRQLPPLDDLKQQPSSTQRLMPCFQSPSIHFENRRDFDRTRTHTKWSAEERQKLSQLYRDVPLPAISGEKELWNFYYQKVAERFVVFFPQRSREDVKEKLRSMLAKKQMKEAGEEAYWAQQQGSRIQQQYQQTGRGHSASTIARKHNQQSNTIQQGVSRR